MTLTADKKPHNPFINSGAMVMSGLLFSAQDDVTKIAMFLKKMSQFAGRHVACSMPAYLANLQNKHVDIAMAHWLFAQGILQKEVDHLLPFYFQIRSIEGTCISTAFMASILANGGVLNGK